VLFLVHRFLSPWWRRRQVPPKRRFLQEPHGVTTQRTPFFNSCIYWQTNERPNGKCFTLVSVTMASDPVLQIVKDRCGNGWEFRCASSDIKFLCQQRGKISKYLRSTITGSWLFKDDNNCSLSFWCRTWTSLKMSVFCKIWGFHGGDYEECSVALVRTDVSEERIASIIRVTRINELGTTLAVTNNRRMLAPAKHRFLQEPHGVISQKAAFFFLYFVSGAPVSFIQQTLEGHGVTDLVETLCCKHQGRWIDFRSHHWISLLT
jgi:hypothetical protein